MQDTPPYFEEVDGRFTVYVNHTVTLNCTTDASCPFDSVCLPGGGWTTSSPLSMCVCATMIARGGWDCTSMSPLGERLFAIYVLTAVFAAVGLTLAVYQVGLLLRAGVKWTNNGMETSLLLCLSAFLSLVVFSLTNFARILSPLAVQPDGSKQFSAESFRRGMTMISLFFLTASSLNVSLLWVEIANHTHKMSATSLSNLSSNYRRGLVIYYVVLITTCTVAQIIGRNDVAVFVAIPGILFVTVTYLMGFFKLNEVLRTMTANTSSSPPRIEEASDVAGKSKSTSTQSPTVTHDPPSAAVVSLQNTLRNIRFASLGTVVMSAAVVGCAGASAISLLIAGPSPNKANTPTYAVNEACGRLMWFFGTLAQFFVLNYLSKSVAATVKRKGRGGAGAKISAKAEGRSATQQGGGVSGREKGAGAQGTMTTPTTVVVVAVPAGGGGGGED